MKKVFFDTWAWVAIAHKDDDEHVRASSFYRALLSGKGVPVTTDYVLAESVTLLRTKTGTKDTGIFFDAVLEGVRQGRILIERIDETRWARTWEMSKKYSDKSHISFFDFSSFVVMKELRIIEAFTADRHFEEIGLGFKKLF